MSELSIADRVAAGAAYLDEHIPDWVRLITVERLDISSGCRCILGQLHAEDYPYPGEMPGEAGMQPGDANRTRIAMGFEVDSDLGDDRAGLEYGWLTDEWARVIEQRRAEVADA